MITGKSFDYFSSSDQMVLLRSSSEAGAIFESGQNLTQSHQATERRRSAICPAPTLGLQRELLSVKELVFSGRGGAVLRSDELLCYTGLGDVVDFVDLLFVGADFRDRPLV